MANNKKKPSKWKFARELARAPYIQLHQAVDFNLKFSLQKYPAISLLRTVFLRGSLLLVCTVLSCNTDSCPSNTTPYWNFYYRQSFKLQLCQPKAHSSQITVLILELKQLLKEGVAIRHCTDPLGTSQWISLKTTSNKVNIFGNIFKNITKW